MENIITLAGAIFWIWIIGRVIRVAVKGQKNNRNTTGTEQNSAANPGVTNSMGTQNYSAPQPPVSQRYQAPPARSMPGAPYVAGTQNVVTNRANSGQAPNGQSQMAMAKQRPPQPVVQTQKSASQSTVDYLKEKAQKDAIEHRKEEMETKKRRREESQIPMALRYTGFETVNPRDKIVVCGYCRAENMVPKYGNAKYRCYFCRENL